VRVALSLLPNGTKTCFVFFVHDQYSASFLATWISAILETGMNQCPGAYTDEKFCRPVKQFFEGGGLVPRVLLKGHNFG